MRNQVFILFLLIKIILLFVFSSEYNSQLFQPFVKSFIDENFQNPWQFYYESRLHLDAFPYHSLMLIILTPFAALSGLLQSGGVFKVPLLFADLGIFYVLKKLFPDQEKSIYIFYFFNPIILYAIYIHSQLDIIPTALMFYGIYLVTLRKHNLSAFITGLALATKIHIVVIIPLLFFYLSKAESIKNALKYLFILVVTFLILDLPFLFSDGFIRMVLLNKKQSLLFDSFYSIGSVKILLPIASILIIYLHFFNQKKINKDLLYFYFGILFTATIFFIYPSPAWYVWMIPFVSIYFIKNYNAKNLVLYYGLCISYLVFFVFFSIREGYQDILFLGSAVDLKKLNSNLANISFTFLEVMLFAIMYVFYEYGIKSNSIYKRSHNLVIGIGGDSGAGKTTLLNNLNDIFQHKMLRIEGDGEHKWERANENWGKYTHLDPKANRIHKQSDAIFNLKNNQTIHRREYDHKKGEFTKLKKVNPKEFIVISGLHPFYLPKLRKNIDFKIYIDTEEKLRRHWKIIRDKRERGYSNQKIIEQIESRMGDAAKYIYPQKEFSDMIVSYFALNDFTLGKSDEIIKLGLKLTFEANIHAEEILDSLNCKYEWDYENDLESQYVEIKSMPENNFEILAKEFIENIDEIIPLNAGWKKGYEGLIQFMLLKIISEKLK